MARREPMRAGDELNAGTAAMKEAVAQPLSAPLPLPTERAGSLRKALRAATAASAGSSGGIRRSLSVGTTSEESHSEEDYDDFATTPAEAMVLRKRRPHARGRTQLRQASRPGEANDKEGDDAEAGEGESTAATATTTATPTAAAATTRNRKKKKNTGHGKSLDGFDVDGGSGGANGGPPSAYASSSSRQHRKGRKLSATIIFEEKRSSSSSLGAKEEGEEEAEYSGKREEEERGAGEEAGHSMASTDSVPPSSLSPSTAAAGGVGTGPLTPATTTENGNKDNAAGGAGGGASGTLMSLREFAAGEKDTNIGIGGGSGGGGGLGGAGRSFVVSIDDPQVAEILRADLEQMREELEERRLATMTGDAASVAQQQQQQQQQEEKQQQQRRRRRRGRFSDFVFTRKFSAFDRQNELAANSPFHGFFTFFWISVFLFVLKMGADNWRKTGSPLGTNEILRTMLHRDVIVLLLSDGVLCALTGVSWLLQRATIAGLVDWDGAGWLLQNVWQALFVAGCIGWTQLRDWPWSHTVFFVLHGLVMLMKQHSYAFYNGYLSTLYRRRAGLQERLRQLANAVVVDGGPRADAAADELAAAIDAEKQIPAARAADNTAATAAATSTPMTTSPDAIVKVIDALESGQPLDRTQARVFARILQWEIGRLTEELRGRATVSDPQEGQQQPEGQAQQQQLEKPDRSYPHNLTFANHYEYIVLPTLVYELEYPRSESINWRYAAEKLVACFGIIFVMIMVSQAFIYPVVMETVAMKEAGIPLAERFRAFPWMLSDLIFPFMMEYLLTWYLIWETILNLLAELTFFADRSFYAAWWNSVTWDEFARDWNRPVHLFLLRHVYHSSISAMRVNKHTATLITFFLSACVHELVMWCIFKKLRGYLLFLQMFQLPLVQFSRTRWMRHRKTLGNVIFWLSIFMGPSILCSLYLIL